MNLIHSPTGMACLIAFFLSLPAMSSMDPFPRALGEAIREAANWRHYCRKLLKGEKGGHGESLPVTKAFFAPIRRSLYEQSLYGDCISAQRHL
ncbi:MAG: hypothetical protein BGO54_13915 [Sphingobacteriales bacterium 46-32]|nr:MAG: hypothetical protein BGO54_13915 [Sphingobacteriales bacterium 46-32]